MKIDSNPILAIVGPTATGKTNLALALAKRLVAEKKYQGIDLISADSRQVYQGLEILTGADIPKGFVQKNVSGKKNAPSFFEKESIRLYGVSIIRPDQEWSVAHFRRLAQSVMKDAWQKNRLPILVGGTGLYHKHALSIDPLLQVAPDQELRLEAEGKTVLELQEWLQKIDQSVFETMTPSDQKNPRRLVRALEKTLAKPALKKVDFAEDFNLLTIGLELPLDEIEQSITQRVAARFEAGAIDEVARLKSKYNNQSLPLFSATGVAQLIAYLDQKISAATAQAQWALKEFQYAKRQYTWWKKEQPDAWFSAKDPALLQEVSALLSA